MMLLELMENMRTGVLIERGRLHGFDNEKGSTVETRVRDVGLAKGTGAINAEELAETGLAEGVRKIGDVGGEDLSARGDEGERFGDLKVSVEHATKGRNEFEGRGVSDSEKCKINMDVR
jgi:hypothetical protein